ncbi:hypothetical protein KAU33_16120 [Candidatus Dependentiae bacterium]|nr:hypothetical protein [Candidatus Dependentiae bacterium]
MEPYVTIKKEEGLKINEQSLVESIRNRAEFLRERASFKEKYPSKYSDFIFKLIKIAIKNGKMGYSFRAGTCTLCGKGENIVRYKSGMNEGYINFDKTWYSKMLDLEYNFVHIKNSTPSGICEECRKSGFDEELRKVLSTLEFKFEWDNKITPCPYVKDTKMICSNCDKEMWESEMGKERRILGSTTYPSTCPHCNAKSVPFGETHQSTKEFRIIKVKIME